MEHYYKIENDDHIVLHLLLDLLIGIMLFLFTFSCLKVSAMEVYNATMVSSTTMPISIGSSPATSVTYGFDPVFHDVALNTHGYVRFQIGLAKKGSTSTDSNVLVRAVAVSIGDSSYLCEVGTATITNSTFNNSTYSVLCPVNMNGGVHSVVVGFNSNNGVNASLYEMTIGPAISYEKVDNVQVNVDTNGIINNQTSNTQNIINNENQNTQDIINSNQVCQFIDNSLVGLNNKYLNYQGSENQSSNHIITNYISLTKNDTLKVVDSISAGSVYACFYNVNKEQISCFIENSYSSGDTVTIPPSASYFRASISKGGNLPTFNLCRNGNQAIVDSQNELKDSLTNHDISDIDLDFFDEITQASDTPITDLLTLPLLYVNKFIDVLDDGTCSPYTIPFDFTGGSNTLTFPCIHLENYLGNTIWSAIDLMICGFMVYNIGMMIISFYESWSSLTDTFDDLYQPKHTYKPKHGGA